jgi:hypothetical protein
MQSVGFCDYSSLEDKEMCQYNKQRIIYTAARMLCQALTKTVPRCLSGMHKPQKLQQSSGAKDKTYLSIKCNPDAVSITGEISPGFRANDASSNSFCMSPCPKKPLLLARQWLRLVTRTPCVIPRRGKSGTWQCREAETYRSPRLRAELQSDSVVARSPRLVEPDLILLS